LTSPNKESVLKGKVRRWLAHWDEVLASAEAPPHAGGGGAVLVLLKGRQERSASDGTETRLRNPTVPATLIAGCGTASVSYQGFLPGARKGSCDGGDAAG
jgi:hypothetical protein